MIDIERYEPINDLPPSFTAAEFCLPSVKIEDLASGMGRFAIFNAIIEHQSIEGMSAGNQVWSGINGVSLVKERSLFGELNPLADPNKLNAHFYATQLNHWHSIIGEVKHSPFTYIYKANLTNENRYPAIIGFEIGKLLAFSKNDNENIDWKPQDGETVDSAMSTVYYFNGLFPDN